MSKRAGKMLCDCGCGQEDYFARLKTVEIEYALDETLTKTRIGHRYLVRPGCYEPFIQELQAKRLLDGYLQRMINAKWRWYSRLWRVRRIVRIQFIINIRNKGLEFTKKVSMRSGILFVCSPRVSNILWLYWKWADRNNLKWRWKWFPRLSRMLALTWISITVTIKRQSPACSQSRRVEGLTNEFAASQLSVVPRLECCKTDGPQK